MPEITPTINSHSNLPRHETAIYRFSTPQQIVLVALILFAIISLILNWHFAITALIALLSIVYFADLLFNFFLIYKSFSEDPEIKVTEGEMSGRGDNWPKYTILCPLYREWQVVPEFISSMKKLDYPADKLQVLLILEEDDQVTQEKVGTYDLPSNFEVLVVPHALPKTKPKACNFALKKATGDFVVIYDAEDAPDPDQLKKAVIAFEKVGEKVVCIQAKLNFYNPRQNLLTRAFTAEYSVWFDLVLTGLQAIHAPIPLGGTSNHFKTESLITLGGWDAYNVTEDCDLGIRIAKRQLRTAVLDSTTHEEANSDLMNWLNQRTRWIKGYIQTYFVHMRKPHHFFTHWTEPHVLTFQLVVGGKVLSTLINPIMWLLTICYFVFRPQIGDTVSSFFPGPVLYISFFSLLIGNFLYMYYYMIGAVKRNHFDLVKYVIFVPFYWLGMSIAAYRAIFEFFVKPHHWHKTVHGLHLANKGNDPKKLEDLTIDVTNKGFSLLK